MEYAGPLLLATGSSLPLWLGAFTRRIRDECEKTGKPSDCRPPATHPGWITPVIFTATPLALICGLLLCLRAEPQSEESSLFLLLVCVSLLVAAICLYYGYSNVHLDDAPPSHQEDVSAWLKEDQKRAVREWIILALGFTGLGFLVGFGLEAVKIKSPPPGDSGT